jgi:hypothetical protein
MFGRRIEKLISTQHAEVEARRAEEARLRAEEFAKWKEDSNRAWEDTREFNREILLRNEKVYTSVIAQLEENTEQTRANTRAVLSVLDRLEDAA